MSHGYRSGDVSSFFIQIWEHAYATAGHGRIVDRFVTCNTRYYTKFHSMSLGKKFLNYFYIFKLRLGW